MTTPAPKRCLAKPSGIGTPEPLARLLASCRLCRLGGRISGSHGPFLGLESYPTFPSNGLASMWHKLATFGGPCRRFCSGSRTSNKGARLGMHQCMQGVHKPCHASCHKTTEAREELQLPPMICRYFRRHTASMAWPTYTFWLDALVQRSS